MAEERQRRPARTVVLAGSAAVVVAGLFVAGFLIGSSPTTTAPATTQARPTATTAPCGASAGSCGAAIDSTTALVVRTGVPFEFTVTTRGMPSARLRKHGRLPHGVAFRSNDDGTATLSGAAASTRRRSAVGVYHLVWVATSGRGPGREVVRQGFTLTVAP